MLNELLERYSVLISCKEEITSAKKVLIDCYKKAANDGLYEAYNNLGVYVLQTNEDAIENDVNVSFSRGNNDAAKIANGEYLLLLNNDIDYNILCDYIYIIHILGFEAASHEGSLIQLRSLYLVGR